MTSDRSRWEENIRKLLRASEEVSLPPALRERVREKTIARLEHQRTWHGWWRGSWMRHPTTWAWRPMLLPALATWVVIVIWGVAWRQPPVPAVSAAGVSGQEYARVNSPSNSFPLPPSGGRGQGEGGKITSAPGSTVTAEGGPVTLTLPNVSLALATGSTVTVEKRGTKADVLSVHLKKGTVTASVVHGTPFVVKTPLGEARAKGTEFQVQFKTIPSPQPSPTRGEGKGRGQGGNMKRLMVVMVMAGIVEVSNALGTVVLAAGEHATVKEGQTPVKEARQKTGVAEPLEVVWFGQAPTMDTLVARLATAPKLQDGTLTVQAGANEQTLGFLVTLPALPKDLVTQGTVLDDLALLQGHYLAVTIKRPGTEELFQLCFNSQGVLVDGKRATATAALDPAWNSTAQVKVLKTQPWTLACIIPLSALHLKRQIPALCQVAWITPKQEAPAGPWHPLRWQDDPALAGTDDVLEWRDGLAYQGGQPFTGRHSTSYHPNGQPSNVNEYREGRSIRLSQYNEKGVLTNLIELDEQGNTTKTQYFNPQGQLVGEQRGQDKTFYDPQGQPFTGVRGVNYYDDGRMKNGNVYQAGTAGKTVYLHPDGWKYQEYSPESGMKYTFFDRDHHVVAEVAYSGKGNFGQDFRGTTPDGQPLTGTLTEEYALDGRPSIVSEWQAGRKVKEKNWWKGALTEAVCGVKDRTTTVWDATGRKTAEIFGEAGKTWVFNKQWNADGRALERHKDDRFYSDGQPFTGTTVISRYPNGNPMETDEYEDGTKVQETRFFEHGGKMSEHNYSLEDGSVKMWSPEGRLVMGNSTEDPAQVAEKNRAALSRLLGVRGRPATPDELTGSSADKAFTVTAVKPKSPAAVATFQPQDVLLTVEGHVVGDEKTLVELIKGFAAGSRLKAEVWRSTGGTGQRLTLWIILS